ncbi:Lipase [Giardia muris]|uniref:sn-1-specific diacylglycerol lipase n=1 Tax=Giardia muris TaxID=5742 RepID=A0A4Z1SYS3_GIAMU|nr:Lipase [Giardia muris]|eukprot:TNJ26813.1 Lipase [Giardia muris]
MDSDESDVLASEQAIEPLPFGRVFRNVVGVSPCKFLWATRKLLNLQVTHLPLPLTALKNLEDIRALSAAANVFVPPALRWVKEKRSGIMRCLGFLASLAPNYSQKYSQIITRYEYRVLARVCDVLGIGTEKVLVHNLKRFTDVSLNWALFHDEKKHRVICLVEDVSLMVWPLMFDMDLVALQDGRVHRGAYRAAMPICDALTLYLGPYLSYRGIGHELVFTGCGFGGSVAAVVALLLQPYLESTGYAGIRCHLFGPMPVLEGTFEAIESGDVLITSYVLATDIVPRLSLSAARNTYQQAVGRNRDAECLSDDERLPNGSKMMEGTLTLGDLILLQAQGDEWLAHKATWTDISTLRISEAVIEAHYLYDDAFKALRGDQETSSGE